ncbi:MAG: Unknown protein [uncultured Sulfurovum sp.]|uniref:Uncharacterized protein n=1 Tax=uncultured Sulfurovum sp. TaxID=269237 RepID=A0A6S6TAN2_9BACT|nr:MAG: Unknown protein [uncultured Sulfurovum sp.]
MKKILLFLIIVGAITFTAVQAKEELRKAEANKLTAMDVYKLMGFVLSDSWSLSPKEEQVDTTGAHENKAIIHLVGDNKAVGTKYKVIGSGATLEEVLLPDTKKSMVTMYHCNSYTNCTKLKATHYCAKKNQPQFLLNLEETRKDKFVFDCDMSTELCNSDEDHIHKMIFELSEEDSHLKASYLAWKDKKLRDKHSIYHFDRM